MAGIKDEVINSLKKAFVSPKCATMIHQLEDLIEFVDVTGVTKYRITDKDDNELTDVAAVLGAIDNEKVTLSYPKVVRERITNIIPPIKVRLGGVFIHIRTGKEDTTLFNNGLSRGKSILGLSMAYCNDNDSEIPLKPIYFETYTATPEDKE